MKPDKIHIITDTSIQNKFSHLELAQFAFDSGIKSVQYREKQFSSKTHLGELVEITSLAQNYQAKLIINDYWEIAQQLKNPYIHLGKEDINWELLNKEPFTKFHIGLTVHNEAECREANKIKNVYYYGIGPVFGSTSKSIQLPELGLKNLKNFALAASKPVIAIGGINLSNIHSVLETGVYGVAILGAFCSVENPAQVAGQLVKIVNSF